jgi:hypothetical protein
LIPDYLAFTAASDYAMAGPFSELINNVRAFEYAKHANLGWVQPCDYCLNANLTGPFLTPSTGAVAPWYNASVADSGRFLGVIGLEVEGADSSTRKVNVTQTLTTGGTIGPPYHGPRTIVVRAVAIALDECALQYGISWVQFHFADEFDPCTADSLVYFDCCFEDTALQSYYMRQFRGVRITEGPEFLRVQRSVSTGGAFAEFELTFVAADPQEYNSAGPTLLAVDSQAPGEVVVDAA